MELWDIYDRNRNKTGKLHQRGIPLKDGDYHLVVHIWIVNSKGEILVSQRHPDKPFPLMWESCGGSVVAGEDSYTGALRELEEELGIVPKSRGILIASEKRDNYGDFFDSWFFKEDVDIKDLTLQEEEVVDAKWVSKSEFKEMFKKKELVHTLSYFLDIMKFYPEIYGLSFRKAENKDLGYLLALRKATMNPHLEKAGMSADDENHMKRIMYHFEAGKIVLFNNEKAGFLKVAEQEEFIDIIQIQIEPRFQNQGLGRKLLLYILHKHKNSSKNFRLEVFKDNPAKKLYESIGFEILEEKEKYYIMEKNGI